MLRDWLWTFAVGILLCGEVGGWACVLRPKLRSRLLSVALALALTAQIHFIASIFGFSSPSLHLSIAIAGAGVLAFSLWRDSRHHSPHLILARFFSPLSWKRYAVWLLLPGIWALLRVTDTLVPHSDSGPLAVNLSAAHLWFEEKGHWASPLNPIPLLGALWEGLYFHIQAIAHGLNITHRSALIRAQLVSQQLHLFWGLGLSWLLFADILASLGLKLCEKLKLPKRHGFGWAAALCLSWIVIAQPSFATSAVLAENGWGAIVFLAASLALLLRGQIAVSGYLAGCALAVKYKVLPSALILFLGVVILSKKDKANKALRWMACAALAILPLIYRDYARVGFSDPGWFTRPAQEFYALAFRQPENFLFLKLLLLLSLVLAAEAGMATVRKRASNRKSALSVLQELQKKFSFAPYFWMLLGLVTIRFPAHLLWQNLAYSSRPAEYFLSEYHPNFEAKLWAEQQLPHQSKIAWTADRQFYYLEQRAATTSLLTTLYEPLRRAKSPADRLNILCDLGFDTLAWEENEHGPEVAGLASLLKLSPEAVLHAVDEVFFFDLSKTCRL